MHILICDYSLSVDMGRWGFTVGPFFVALTKDNDIARMLCLRDMLWTSNFAWEWPQPNEEGAS